MSTTPPDDRVVTVGDTEVGLYEYGDPDGQPVITLHGTPACGAGFQFADEPAKARGLRLIAPDRPGVGRSSGPPLATVAEYPARVAALADELGLERFAVWGYSGGGPYAVACAALLGDRVTATAVAAGMGQMGVWAEADDFAKTDKQFLGLSVKHPALARFLLGTTARLAKLSPKSAMKSFGKELSESDREVIPSLGPPEDAMALFLRAFTHGARGCVDDYRTIAHEWGCPIEAHAPVAIFQGDADTMVPARHSEELHQRLGGSTLTVWPGAGHLGTLTHVEEVLDSLRRP